MKTEILNLDTSRIKTFISENKMILAAAGGLLAGITIASLMGNEKARQMLRSVGTTVADVSGKFVSNLGGYKQMLAPLLTKGEVQGL